MSFDLINAQMSTSVINTLGESVAYHSHTGTIRTFKAVIDKDVEVFPGGFDSGVSERMTEITFLKTDVPDLKRDDQVVYGRTRYTVQDVVEDDGVVVRVTVR